MSQSCWRTEYSSRLSTPEAAGVTVLDLREERSHSGRTEPWRNPGRLWWIEARLSFIKDAEDDSWRRLDRPLTDDKLRRVLQRYPGDWLRARRGRAAWPTRCCNPS